jgi:hypothetical protein
VRDQSVYPLRLPRSIKAEVERRAKADGTSVNQFVATAVAEKLAVMGTAELFAERRSRADFAVFDQLMRRTGRELPKPDDTIPHYSSVFLGIKDYIETGMRRRQEFYQPVIIRVLLESNNTASVADIATAFHQHDPALSLKYYQSLLTKRRRVPGTVGYVLEKYGQVKRDDDSYRLRNDVGQLAREEREELIRLLDEKIAEPRKSYRGNLARRRQGR